MKEANFIKRLSAITLAAAITAANVGFDFLPAPKKAAAEPKEEQSVTEIKTPEVMTQKSKYPTSLSFIVEQNENGESVLKASNPTVFNKYFTAELVSLDAPAEGEEPEQPVFSAAGTVIRKGGNYTVVVRAKVDEETGELLYNPYKIVDSAVPIAEETEASEAEAVPQEIAVIDEGESTENVEVVEEVQEAVSEEAPAEEQAESAEIAEVPAITEISLNICESDVNAAFGLFDMSQSQKLDYTVVKSQGSYNVMIPDDYDELFLNGIDEEGVGYFNAAGEDVQVNFNEVEMNIQIVNFAELKVKDAAAPEECVVERFCGEESLPYYYGEIMKVTPPVGYNIVIGDMKYSDAVSVAVNDDVVEAEERWVTVNLPEKQKIAGEEKEVAEIVPADPSKVNADGKFLAGSEITVQPVVDGYLMGTSYTLSIKDTSLIGTNQPLTFTLTDDVIGGNDTIDVIYKIVYSYTYVGFSKQMQNPNENDTNKVIHVSNESFSTQTPAKSLRGQNKTATMWWNDGYSTPYISIPTNVKATKVYIKAYDGEEKDSVLAEYDVTYKTDGTLAVSLNRNNSSITGKDAIYNKNNKYVFFPIDLNKLHSDIYIDVDYDVIVKFNWSFSDNTSTPKPSENIVNATLNGKELDNDSLYSDVNVNNYINFTINEANETEWEITDVTWTGRSDDTKYEDGKGYSIGKTNEVKEHGKYDFSITATRKTIDVTVEYDTNAGNVEKADVINANEEFTLTATPKQGYYVDSITKNGKPISFTVNDDGAVKFSDKSTENVDYKVNFAVCPAASLDDNGEGINAVVVCDNHQVYDDGNYNFAISDISEGEGYKVQFKSGDTVLKVCKEEKDVINYSFLEESKETYNDNNNTYYILSDNVIYKAVLNVKSVTAEPVIESFDINPKEDTAGKEILKFLSFGIFGNDKNQEYKLTVTAKDNGIGFEISDIELWINNVSYIDYVKQITGKEVEEPSLDGTSKTYILPQNNETSGIAYNIKAVAYSKHDSTDETAVNGNVYVIDPKRNGIEVYDVESKEWGNISTTGKGIVIEAIAPTLSLSEVNEWYDANGVNINVTAAEPPNESGHVSFKDKPGNILFGYQSGIAYVQYEIGDEDVEINSETSEKIYCEAKDGVEAENFSSTIKIAKKDDEPDVLHKTVKVVAYDNAGNQSVICSREVNIDAAKPVINEITAKKADGSQYGEGTWTNQRVILEFNVTDVGAGVDKVYAQKLILNESGVYEPSGNKEKIDGIERYAYRIDTDFSGMVQITATDKVGNPAESKTFKVNMEKNAPEIKSFHIEALHENPKISETDLTNTFKVDNGYQYFFDVAAKVQISTVDNGISSGVSEVRFGKIASGSNIVEYVDPVKKDNAEFPVEEGFEGTFVIQVVDNAGNESIWYTPEMLIAEDLNNHDIHSEVDIILDQTNFSNDGKPLYAEAPNITFKVKDTASGIKEITYTIQTVDGIAKSETKTITKDQLADFLDTPSTKIHDQNIYTYGTFTKKLSEYEGNEIVITLEATDNADNPIGPITKTISIDTTPPEIRSITFDPKGSENQEFFNKKRTATIRAKDSNLRLDNLNEMIDVTVTNALGASAAPYKVTEQWHEVEPKKDETKGSEKVYECKITFTQDAEYSFSMSVDDLAGHHYDDKETYNFIIDTTAPKLSISFDNNAKSNDKYYNAARKATLTINEHNFANNKDSVKSVLAAKGADGITTMDSKEIYDGKLTWTQSASNKDEWTAQVNFNKEGTFDFSMAYTDPAGNNGNNADTGEFVIDMTAPTITHTFTKNGNTSHDGGKFAVAGELVPHVTFEDYNFLSENQIGNNCKVTIKKFGENGLSSENFSATSRTYTAKREDSPVTFEQIFDIFKKDITVDGIYEISIRAEDLAGNVTEINDLTVSVNRYGSTYMIVNEEAKKAVEMYSANKIPINENIEFVIAEVNVSPLKKKGTVRIDIDGNSLNELKDGFETEDSRVSLEDDSWEINEDGWYQTTYKIDKKNFEKDGEYTVSLISEDEAGNMNKNFEATSPKASLVTTFAVDTTAPTVIIAGMDEAEYKESSINVTVICQDRFLYDVDSLNYDPNNEENSTFYIKINGEPHNISSLKSQLGAEITNTNSNEIKIEMKLKAEEKNQEETVEVVMLDKASNSTIETAVCKIWVVDDWWMILLIIAGVLVLGTAVFFVTKKVRNH